MEYSRNMGMQITLSSSALQRDWKVVVDMYHNHKAARTMEIIGGRGTALHVAVNDGRQDIVKVLLESITGEAEQLQVLQMKDESGDTPLHLAASMGFKGICKLIIGPNMEREHLITTKNKLGETPLFLATLVWEKQTFPYLLSVFQNYANHKKVLDYLPVLYRHDGDTILHSAIRRQYFDLAVIIIHYCPKLHNLFNTKGFTPLGLLANTPSAFRSSSMLSWTWWRRIIYHSIEVKDLDVRRTMERYLNENDEPAGDPEHVSLPPNYLTCYAFFTMLKGLGGCNILPRERKNGERSATDEHKISMPLPKLDSETSQSHLVPEMQSKEVQNYVLPPNYVTFEQLLKFAYTLALGLHGEGVKVIRKIKKKHTWARQLLIALMQNPFQAYNGTWRPEPLRFQPIDGQSDENDEDIDEIHETHETHTYSPPLYQKAMQTKQNQASKERDPEAKDNIDWNFETALLIAAKNGIVEIVKVILSLIPTALHDTTLDKRNIFHVAIKYRQPLLVEALLNNLSKPNIKKLVQAVDNDENTMLHLAADAISIETPLKIPGSAVQMMWDIKWCEYIEGLVPKHFTFRTNKADKTSGEIFTESHKELLKESSEWLKETSESCSVVAALVAGVTFATSSTVPGGTDEGKPVLEGQSAFEAFGISTLIGLCFSVTALIMFLSIIISKKKAQDFRRNLPLKLLLGLTTLLISIVAMFVSFCAAHFFVLKDKYWHIVFPIYVFTCLPVTFYSMAQFPLYSDLLRAFSKTLPRTTK